MIPGVTTRPCASMTVAPAGGATVAPTAVIRRSAITTVPFGISGAPGERMSALMIAVGAEGRGLYVDGNGSGLARGSRPGGSGLASTLATGAGFWPRQLQWSRSPRPAKAGRQAQNQPREPDHRAPVHHFIMAAAETQNPSACPARRPGRMAPDATAMSPVRKTP